MLETNGSGTETMSRSAVSLDPTRLPSLTATTSRQHRLAVDGRLVALLSHALGVENWRVGTRNLVDINCATVVTLRWGIHSAAVRIDAAQHPGMESVIGSGAGANVALRNAVGALLLTPLLRAFETLGMQSVEIASLERAATPSSESACCALAFRLGSQRIDATLEQIDSGWLDALEALVAQQCTPFATHVSEIAVPGRLLIGEKAMSVTTLESLRPGDVIMRAVSGEMSALLRRTSETARAQVIWGCYGARQLCVLANVTHHTLILKEDPTMSHDTQFSAPLTDTIDSPVEISRLDLPLRLEIDTVSLPVAQLSALRAGYVLELPTAVPDARIRLVTYGQTIAFGELVSVGDHLGVRLVQLSSGQ
ncbi:type III secretion system cytoplasmic ring protein SctQ [Paraburkholderia sp. SARCC-3016]|uniref:type III secretion system cytoplasmic ring protein SctQ n=1 Tax=Paraburkholderia sp. SARCC-3016 TaxID=3058611 RepID=UPI002807C91A|nr:type III secretion system cytoplasmic ring protein SctQ [Paraburkholderia sp. SARCC-3016]MDQ7980269.1 type III secretion system cytoplasmic ring protein SctQ [Paraburkholderia sp. SARCC-3016]